MTDNNPTSNTPRSNELEALRIRMGQDRTPAYGDALRLCRSLEAEVARLTQALKTANDNAERFERKSYLLNDRVEDLETALKECVSWANDCVKDVLYPLSHETTKLGAFAEGLGGSSVAIINKANEILEAPRPE